MKYEKSCGAVIFEGDKVLVIQQVKGHWGFPKGHVEDGETEVETAIRLLEQANMEMAKQLEQLRSETNESFIQAGNFDTPGGKVAVSNIENFIDTDGKSFHDIMPSWN